MIKRGEEIARPLPWTVRPADSKAAKGWSNLVAQFVEAADRAWVAITSDPRRTDGRQHRLKGDFSIRLVAGCLMEQWQFEITSGGRIWYAIDDRERTLWITYAGTGHPKRTER